MRDIGVAGMLTTRDMPIKDRALSVVQARDVVNDRAQTRGALGRKPLGTVTPFTPAVCDLYSADCKSR